MGILIGPINSDMWATLRNLKENIVWYSLQDEERFIPALRTSKRLYREYLQDLTNAV